MSDGGAPPIDGDQTVGDPEVEPGTLLEWLDAAETADAGGSELALLDARERGGFARSHLFHAVNVPLSRLELDLPRLVPRRAVRLVWCDEGGPNAPAAKAAAAARCLGYGDIRVLSGGTGAWVEAGGVLHEGLDLASTALAHRVATTYGTPSVPPDELARRLADRSGPRVVAVDVRPFRDFQRGSVSGSVSAEGVEAVYRAKELVADDETAVVVIGADRSESVIWAQSLIAAGLPNPVSALAGGIAGWSLAGHRLEGGATATAPTPSAASADWAVAASAAVAGRFGVRRVDLGHLVDLIDDAGRTTVLVDVRTSSEYRAGHLAGSISAPGGRLIRAVEDFVAVRGARLVVVDDDGARAAFVAAWLRRLGWSDTLVADPDVAADQARLKGTGRDALSPVSGPAARPRLPAVPAVNAAELGRRIAAGRRPTILDLDHSDKYRRRGRIPGSWWGVRSRLDEARSLIGPAEGGQVVLTSADGLVARLAVPEAQALWPDAEVMALAGGTKAWRHAGLEMDEDPARAERRMTTEPDDVWPRPGDRPDSASRSRLEEHLVREKRIADRVADDETVRFPTLD